MLQSPYLVKAECMRILHTCIGERLATQWWDSPNHVWDGLTPAKQFDADPRSVLAYITAHLQR